MEMVDVFTAGGLPSVTYHVRDNLGLERKLTQRLKVGGKVISMTGPTKIGKTVLWKKVIPEDKRVFVPGGNIREEIDVWNHILSELGYHSSWTEEQSNEEETKKGDSVGAGVQGTVLGVIKLKTDYKHTHTKGEKQSAKTAKSFSVSPIQTAINLLVENDLVLVIDDFHYIDREIQTRVIRAIKEPITTGLRVLICAVPHRDHDALKAERDMAGRGFQIPVAPWESIDLKEIAEKGFNALNLTCSPEIIDTFVQESYKSPHLMQEFCLTLCFENSIEEEQQNPTQLQAPSNYDAFFEEIVNSSTSKEIYEKLLEGPNNRDRKTRYFKNGSEGDIYTAVMHALADLLDSSAISPDVIKRKLQEILEPSSVPNINSIKTVLQKMSDIARDTVDGEPPVDYQDNLLHVVDPFFSFYLKWCEK